MPRQTLLPNTRREFVKGSTAGIGLLAFSQFAPGFLTRSLGAQVPTNEPDRSILVLVQLGGGNDGLNTLVPYQDDNYYRLRPTLGLKRPDLLPLDDQLALHASCPELERLYKDGSLAVVQNVGYPNPNRSHFRSTEIWETASDSDEYLNTGWMGRYFDSACAGAPSEEPIAVNIGNELPDAFLSENDFNIFSYAGGRRRSKRGGGRMLAALQESPPPQDSPAGFLQHTLMNSLVTEEKVVSRLRNYKPLASYPTSPLGTSLRQVAGLIASGQPTRVYYVSHTGFDTHANQLQTHAQLLAQLSQGMAAFQDDLAQHGLQDQVLTMTFSEFGRRPSENKSRGTDHGTAAPLFVMGSQLKGGLHGSAPSLKLKKNRDLSFSADFRSIYATVIDRWLGGDSQQALGGSFEPIDFL